MSHSIPLPRPAAEPLPVAVNGVVIPRTLITREVQNHPAPSAGAAWRAATLALVVREALAQEAARLKVVAEALVDGDGRQETEDEARMRALVEREVHTPTPSQDECRRYYQHNAARFRSPDRYEAAHILIAARPDDADAYEEARHQARAMIAALAKDPDCFAQLAGLHSRCPSGKTGGKLGQIVNGQTTPEFEAALCNMRPGEISRDPVEARYGVHVVRLDRRIEGVRLPFERVRDRIADYLTKSVRRRAEAQYVARLLAACRIDGLEIPAPGERNVH